MVDGAATTPDWNGWPQGLVDEPIGRLVESYSRFLTRSLGVVAHYHDEYLRELVPTGRSVGTPPPPLAVPPTGSADVLAWLNWYQRAAAWMTEQQAWAGRVYKLVVDEVAAGVLPTNVMQASARQFLERRFPDYMSDMADLNAELAADILGVAGSSIWPGADPPLAADEMTVEVRGPAGGTGGVSLLVENSRAEPALVACQAVAGQGFTVVTAPQQFQLGSGESRAVAIRVTLPQAAKSGTADAGQVAISGHGDRDLIVRLRAVIDRPED